VFIDFFLFIAGVSGLISIMFNLANNNPTDLNQVIAYIAFIFIGNYAFFKTLEITTRNK